MATDRRRAADFIRRVRARVADPPSSAPGVPDNGRADVALGRASDAHSALERLSAVGAPAEVVTEILDEWTLRRLSAYEGVVERFVGTAKIPIGLVGPLLVNGLHARGSYAVPLATSEPTLVSSYNRGARALTRSGGVASMLLAESVARSPCFVFDRVHSAGRFVEWLTTAFDELRAAAEGTSSHARLEDLRFTVEGNRVYVGFEYYTGDAAGQNMTTIATEAACRWILGASPVTPERWFLEGNLSGDKKSSAQSYCLVRGRKVTADAVVPAGVLREELRCTAEEICEYWRVSAMGGVLSGTLGVQGHFANGLAALFLATGQDMACVAECSVGVTRLEPRADGALYAAVTLPSLVLGTVGGGTRLPSAAACLRLMGIEPEGGAPVLAEVAAALLLAGELSLVGAVAAGSFGRAHRLLRRRPPDHGERREDGEPR